MPSTVTGSEARSTINSGWPEAGSIRHPVISRSAAAVPPPSSFPIMASTLQFADQLRRTAAESPVVGFVPGIVVHRAEYGVEFQQFFGLGD